MLQIMVMTKEMKMLCPTVTYPAEGVIATKPTTHPTAAPMAEGLRPRRQSKKIQVIMAVAEAVLVLRNALIACPSACSEEPALKPNQPSHNMAAPKRTNGMLAGSLLRVSAFLRPRKMAPASAATPLEACTTIPPAKSITPHFINKPSGCQVM